MRWAKTLWIHGLSILCLTGVPARAHAAGSDRAASSPQAPEQGSATGATQATTNLNVPPVNPHEVSGRPLRNMGAEFAGIARYIFYTSFGGHGSHRFAKPMAPPGASLSLRWEDLCRRKSYQPRNTDHHVWNGTGGGAILCGVGVSHR